MIFHAADPPDPLDPLDPLDPPNPPDPPDSSDPVPSNAVRDPLATSAGGQDEGSYTKLLHMRLGPTFLRTIKFLGTGKFYYLKTHKMYKSSG